MSEPSTVGELADAVRRRAVDRGLTIAVAESLTGGSLSATLARAEGSGDWFAGGVVSYRTETKQRALGVPPGPVVTPAAARAMAEGVLRLTGADAAVAVSGVGGPGEQEGKPPGTVHIGLAAAGRTEDVTHRFAGTPEDVVEQTITHALRHLVAFLDGPPPRA